MKPAIHAALPLIAMFLIADPAAAFRNNDTVKNTCVGCHTLSREEAAAALHGIADNVTAVVPGPFPGVWEVDTAVGGKIFPIYLDFSRKYFFQGQFIRLADKENITRVRYEHLNRVDVSSIPLKNAILLGNPASKRRIIVFTDPSCPYCVKLHGEIKKAIEKDREAAFYIMPYPRNPNDKATYEKCRAAVCDKSGKLLDDAFSGKELPPPSCGTDAVEETIRLTRRLQTQGTPSMILPDGRLISGFREADALLSLTR